MSDISFTLQPDEEEQLEHVHYSVFVRDIFREEIPTDFSLTYGAMRVIDELVTELDPAPRSVLQLYLAGMGLRQIAERKLVSWKNVYTHYNNSCNKLRNPTYSRRIHSALFGGDQT